MCLPRSLLKCLWPAATLLAIATVPANGAPATTDTKALPYRYSDVTITGGGFITGLIAHPKASNVIYTRTDIGSSYRWDVPTDQWIPLTDFISQADFNLFGTESIALDPTDASRLYLAQGQYLSSNNSAFFVSTDRGSTFNTYPAPFRMGSNELGRNMGERLAVNPFNTKQLYMGTRQDGLWVSNDRAKTWTNVTSFLNAAANGIGLVFVVFDPSKEGTIYVGAHLSEGLYYTQDGGTTWASVPGQPSDWSNTTLFSGQTPQSTAPQPMRAVLASDGNLYITYGDAPGPYGIHYGQVQKYNTKLSTWTNITPGMNGNSYPAPYKPQAFPIGGFCAVAVDVNDPNYVIVVSLDRDPGPALDSMYLSRDGGQTWKDVAQLSTPMSTRTGNTVNGYWGHPYTEAALKNGTRVPWLSFDWTPDSASVGAPDPVIDQVKFGWWIAAVLINPSNPDQVWYGTGATIWATDDITRVDHNWAPTWYVNAQGIEMTAVLGLISPTSGAHLLSAFGDLGGFVHNQLWQPQPMYSSPYQNNVNSIDWSGSNPNVIVRVGVSGPIYPGGCGLGAYSTDGGQGWSLFPSCVQGATNSSGSGGYVAIDSSAQHIVWNSPSPPAGTGPYYSSDFGATWAAPTGLTVSTGNVASDKVQPGTFYAYTGGSFYISTDGGASYTSSTPTGLPSGGSATLVVSYNTAGEIWLPLGSNGIFHSTDFGSSFKQIGTKKLNINAAAFSIGKGPGARNHSLYLWGTITTGGANGLYRSDDNGNSWVRINDDSHQYGGPSVIQGDSQTYGRCYLGMNGRGIVFADITEGSYETGVMPGTYGI